MIEIYRQAVKQSIRAVTWDDSSFYFYLLLIFLAVIIGWIAESRKRIANTTNNSFLFLLLFFLLAIPCSFRDTGDDTEVYRYLFLNAQYTDDPEVSLFEPGFIMLNRLLGLFIGDEIIGVAVFSAISFFFIIASIKRNCNRINVAIAIMGFVCIYYLQMYDLMRIYLATSIIVFAFMLFEKKDFFKVLILISFCSLIHYSTIVLLIPFFGYFLFQKSKKAFWISYAVMFVILLGAVSYLEDYILLINRYEGNVNHNEVQSIGPAQFIYHFPLFLVLFLSYKNRIWDNLTDWLLVFSLISLLLGLFSYKMPIAGRLNVHMMVIYTLLLPHQLYLFKVNKYKYRQPITAFIIVFLMFKLHLYLLTGLATDGIMPYKFAY